MMNKVLKGLISSLSLFLFFVISCQTAFAQSINYHAYKYGTHQTSMADGYYARPADVKADGNQYLVTMTIRTKKSLSPYPVKVLSIDGQAPINVVKTRHGSDYDYRYSFRTNNLKHDINSKISIDVPNVYKATHDITFSFDTSNLPKLSDKKSSSSTKHSAVVTNTNGGGKNGASGADSEALLAQAQSQSDAAKKKQAALAQQQMAQNSKNQVDNERNQKMFYYTVLGGTISLIVLIIAAVFFVISGRNNKSKKVKDR